MPNRDSCPVCGSVACTRFLERHDVPVHQNLLVADPMRAKAMARGQLLVECCGNCGFIFNRAFDQGLLSYGPSYNNSQTSSQAFLGYVDELARRVLSGRNLRDRMIFEVGCGDGLFLKKLVADTEARNLGRGYDPSYTGPVSEFDGRLLFTQSYFDPSALKSPADVIICRHVIEHVPHPVELIRLMRAALVEAAESRVFIETPSSEWILGNRVIWDFFYEHCSYFGESSLSTACEMSNLEIVDSQRTFAGQYLWVEARIKAGSRAPKCDPDGIPSLAAEYGHVEADAITRLGAAVRALASSEGGRIALWGAGAKGVTLANLLDPLGDQFVCVVDINPAKQGRYLPGTGHPILSFKQLPSLGVTAVILPNPNYYEENVLLMERAGIKGVRLVDLMSPDFAR